LRLRQYDGFLIKENVYTYGGPQYCSQRDSKAIDGPGGLFAATYAKSLFIIIKFSAKWTEKCLALHSRNQKSTTLINPLLTDENANLYLHLRGGNINSQR